MKTERNSCPIEKDRGNVDRCKKLKAQKKMIQYARNIHLIKATHVLHRIKYTFMMNHIGADACRGIVNQTREKIDSRFYVSLCKQFNTDDDFYFQPLYILIPLGTNPLSLESH